MQNDPTEVLRLIPDDARVLDIGAAAAIFPRADAVIDVQPYETRQPGPLSAEMPERFSRDTWHIGDICDEKIWHAFESKSFDFVICSHVLEDIRDPIFVCQQMIRIGRAGYIETPSRFRECAKVSALELTAGWEHHRWIVDAEDGTLVFTFKNPLIYHFDFIPEKHRQALQRPDLTALAVHWQGSFDCTERSHKGSTWEVENLFDYYQRFDYETLRPLVTTIRDVPPRNRTHELVTDFKLPLEDQITENEVLERHAQRLAKMHRRGPIWGSGHAIRIWRRLRSLGRALCGRESGLKQGLV